MRLRAPTCAEAVLLTTRLAIAATGLHWLRSGAVLELGVTLTALGLTLLPGRLLREPALRDATATTTALLLAVHVVLGMHGGLYETSAAYDKVMHVLGSAAVALLAALAVRGYCARRRIDLPTSAVSVLAAGAALSAGALWEMFEFAIDGTGMFRAQRGLDDTMLDLVADAFGASLAAAALAAAYRPRRALPDRIGIARGPRVSADSPPTVTGRVTR